MPSSPSDLATLAGRIRSMETTVGTGGAPLPIAASGRALLPRGLREGGVYAVRDSTTLACALLAGPSEAGRWTAVVGVDGFGAEAAAALGVDLGRTLVVPTPGPEWLEVLATMIPATSMTLVAVPHSPRPGEAARVAARLRRHGAALVTLLPEGVHWPRTDATIRLVTTRWHGIGAGRGRLTGRDLEVEIDERGRPRRVVMQQDSQGRLYPAGQLGSQDFQRDHAEQPADRCQHEAVAS